MQQTSITVRPVATHAGHGARLGMRKCVEGERREVGDHGGYHELLDHPPIVPSAVAFRNTPSILAGARP